MNSYTEINRESFWQIQDASAKFSQLVKKVKGSGTQVITKRGTPVVVVMSKQHYDELTRPSNSLLAFFRETPLAEIDLDISRSNDLPREVEL